MKSVLPFLDDPDFSRDIIHLKKVQPLEQLKQRVMAHNI